MFDREYRGTIDGSIKTVWAIRDGEIMPSPRDVEHLVALYRGEIAFTDAQLARLLAELEARGLGDNTLIVLAGDHGESFGEHGGWRHVALYAPEIEVPLIVRLPGGLPATEIASAVSTVDIAPTILDALGVAAPKEMDGRSLLLLAQRPADGASRVVFTHFHDDWYLAATGMEWKLIADLSEGKHELYHLASDPAEERNRIEEAGWEGSEAAAAWKQLSGELAEYLERQKVKRRGPLRLPEAA